MDPELQYRLSCYRTCAPIRAEHGVFLVQHIETGKFYVKKLLTVYDRAVYDELLREPVPGLPRVRLLAEEDGLLTVIEEQIPGDTLEECLRTRGAFPAAEAADILCQLCDILERLHSRRPALVHRDIKPSNVMLTPDGRVRLLDLNAARQGTLREEDTRLLGTKGYAAPEQYGFGSSGPQADIYALGRLLNTLLWGEYRTELYPDRLLGPIMEDCVRLDPKQRPAGAGEVKRRLKAAERRAARDPRSFLLPGFRRGIWWHMLLAGAVYAFLLSTSLTMPFEEGKLSPPQQWVVRFLVFAFPVSIICCVFNYRNLWRFIPLCRSPKPLKKAAGVLLLTILVGCAVLLLCVILGAILEGEG